MTQDHAKYEEWLTTIANTRFIYNTMEELEEVLDNHSIHSNGIKRSFPTPQKLRSAFRDLKGEVEIMTENNVDLDSTLNIYHKAWTFFHEKLYRRNASEQLAMELLAYCYPPYHRDNISKKNAGIFKQIIEQDISIPFVILMLLKVIPGTDSKGGDVIDMPIQYERVMRLMERFTNNGSVFSVLPAIIRAREEQYKSRLTLLYHITQILDTYETFNNEEYMYDNISDTKANAVNLDIVGFWNECEGKAHYTDFWQIEDALKYGTYFVTHWRKDAQNKLTSITYSMIIYLASDGNLIYYMIHPEAIVHRMNGLSYADNDHAWYQTDILENTPDRLPLLRLMSSNFWQQKINLTRVTDEEVLAQYDKWINHDCEIVNPYKEVEYYFRPDIYAITQSHIYITSENEGEYYKVPRSAHEGFDRIQLNDDVGIMTMNNKTFIAFDEFLLYIETTDKELQKYGIERVNSID